MDPAQRVRDLTEALEGRYRVERELGSGGMAVVYLAHQSEPVRRAVALKVLSDPEAADSVLPRFEAERQALAVMDHPGIAKVFDAGITTDGRPYFAMEVVDGSRINDFCDAHKLGVSERVRLFLDVCRAVQHAHQKGVIHRDLKPSNVLVSEVDGRPLPRIIDFGIAKAVEAEGFDGTDLTRADEIIGTPAYMSPEQISGSADIDTRSDIYSLGVMFFELLVGALPYGRDAYRGWAALAAHLHRDPPTPAQRFSEVSNTQMTVAGNRNTTPSELQRELSGDVGWILSRAMEKDRDDRYETANGFALDLERFLANEPIRARSATAAYVVRKFVRRNRVGVGFAAILALGLVGFAGAMTVQADRIARARDEAESRRGQAEGLIDFMLGDLREKLEPVGRLDLLDDVGREAVSYFASLPEDQFSEEELQSRSQALYQIGSVRLNQGRLADAEVAFAESLRLAEELTARDPDDVDWLFGQSQSHFWVGYAAWLQSDLATAEGQFLEYLRIAEALVAHDSTDTAWQLELGYAHSNLGSVREAQNDLEGALVALRGQLEIKQRLALRDPANTGWQLDLARGHNKVGVVLEKVGDLAGAETHYEADLLITTALVQGEPDNAIWLEAFGLSRLFLGDLARVRGRGEESLGHYRGHERVFEGLVERDEANTDWGASLALARRNVGRGLAAQGDLDEAEASLALSRVLFEELIATDPDQVRFQVGLAATGLAQGALQLDGDRAEDALSEARRAVALLERLRASDEMDGVALLWLGESHMLEGDALVRLGRDELASQLWEKALATTVSPGARAPMAVLDLRARALLQLGRREEASALVDSLTTATYRTPELMAAARIHRIEISPPT